MIPQGLRVLNRAFIKHLVHTMNMRLNRVFLCRTPDTVFFFFFASGRIRAETRPLGSVARISVNKKPRFPFRVGSGTLPNGRVSARNIRPPLTYRLSNEATTMLENFPESINPPHHLQN